MVKVSAPIPLLKILADLDATETEATEIVESVSDGWSNWRSVERLWTIVQYLTHLSRINRIYAAARHGAVAKQRLNRRVADERGIGPSWFGVWFIRSMEPPVSTRIQAPSKTFPPTEPSDWRTALTEFLESLVAVRNGSSQLEQNAIGFVPGFPPQ